MSTNEKTISCSLTLYDLIDKVFIMQTTNQLLSYIQKFSVILIALFLFLFPLAFSTLTTELFAIPKQLLLAIASLITIVLFAIKTIAQRSLRIRRTPFDLSIAIFTIVIFLSSLLAVNKADAITSFTVAFLGILLYFSIVNLAKDKKTFLLLTISMLLGGTVSAILSILSFFKIYIFSYPFVRIPTFTTLGSLLDQAIYFSLLLSIAVYLLLLTIFKTKDNLALNPSKKFSPLIRKNITLITSASATICILIALLVTFYNLFYVQKPTILPFETGFQTAFAAISQDEGRTLKGFLFGSGFGTYNIDFSRFKQISFNQNSDLWPLAFFRSSSFILELLATTGILSVTAFVFILIKVLIEAKSSKTNPIIVGIVLIFAGSLFLPYSFTIQTLLFVILALFAVYEGLSDKKQNKFFDVELQIVTLRQGLLALEAPNAKKDSLKNLILPVLSGIIIIVTAIGIGYYSFQYVSSDISFQKSIIAFSKNNGSLTFQEQVKAIRKFPFKDGFYRVYSQTNFALANALASQSSDGKTLDKNTQETIIKHIQESINSARTATAIAPHTALNWQNLSSIYRGLIGFGQDADTFAIAAQQQAILLDPNNPQQYITLGGIYYQLGQWDNAQNQFQVAIKLKPDFPNAYYNLGHVLQERKDINGALSQYQIVKTLVTNTNLDALKQITAEMESLTSGKNAQNESSSKNEKTAIKSLEIDDAASKLPPTEPKVEIPALNTATKSSE